MYDNGEILVKGLSAGDMSAYSEVYKMFYVPLVCYSQKYVKDQYVAEDIVQDFFCRLWEERRKLERIQSYKAYFYSSVRNSSLNYLRDNRMEPIGNQDSTDGDFLGEMMREEIFCLLYGVIQTLPPTCRQIMSMYLEGKGNREIAEQLDVTEDTVRSQLRRGRELLHDKLCRIQNLILLLSLSRGEDHGRT